MRSKSSPSSENIGSARRPYRSPLRAAQAQETRRRIIAASVECFSSLGYSRTTLAQIGKVADVSAESVAANGPKAALLMAGFEYAFTGREGTDPVTQREELGAMLAIDDVNEMLAAFAAYALRIQRDGIGMWRAIQDAAAQDDTVAGLYRDLMERRRHDHELAIQALLPRGILRTDRTPEQLAATLALINGFDPYQLLVLDFGWDDGAFLDWYVDSLRRTLLADPSGR